MHWRFASTEDLPLLARLNHQLIADEGHMNPMNVEALEHRMAGWIAGEYTAVLFEEAGAVVAYALFRDHELEATYLRQFFVERGLRRRGLGRRAMRLLFDEVLPGRRLRLDVLAHNAAGRAFWAALGFREHALMFERRPR